MAADDMDAMLFEPAPKITAAKKKPVAPAKTSITPSVTTGGIVMKPDSIKDGEFDFNDIEPALPDEESPVLMPIAATEKSVKAPTIGIKPTPKTQKSLTETIKETADEDNSTKDSESPLSGTWVEKLANTSFSGTDEEKKDIKSKDGKVNLENMVSNSKDGNRRSNASVFDISGIMLRMTLPQIEAAMTKRGFKLTSQKFEIPNFIKWRFEEQCRNSGVVGYERLANCVVKAAKENNHQYVESEKFSKYDTQEEITVYLTSNFTNNKVYKVLYQSLTTKTIRGSGQKTQYLRDIKIYDFWRKINQKYGVPDNKEDVIWGMGGNKPYMKASTGFLLLEDPMLKELDFTRMSREDSKYMNTNLYNF